MLQRKEELKVLFLTINIKQAKKKKEIIIISEALTWGNGFVGTLQ